MFCLTAHERKILLILALVILAGALMRYFNVYAVKPDEPIIAKSPCVLLNVNTAGADDLAKLPGVGPALARRIIDYRVNVLHFYSIEDLTKVKGIGEKLGNKIKSLVKFSD